MTTYIYFDETIYDDPIREEMRKKVSEELHKLALADDAKIAIVGFGGGCPIDYKEGNLSYFDFERFDTKAEPEPRPLRIYEPRQKKYGFVKSHSKCKGTR